MHLQKQFLENNSWTCSSCGCTGSKGFDCINANYKGYMITLKGMARIFYKGRVIVSTQLYNLENKMREQKLIQMAAV